MAAIRPWGERLQACSAYRLAYDGLISSRDRAGGDMPGSVPTGPIEKPIRLGRMKMKRSIAICSRHFPATKTSNETARPSSKNKALRLKNSRSQAFGTASPALQMKRGSTEDVGHSGVNHVIYDIRIDLTAFVLDPNGFASVRFESTFRP